MTEQKCESCEVPGGFYTSGTPGVLAHMKEGKPHPEAKPERCDTCCRFPSDKAATEALLLNPEMSNPS